ncbi:hypothetical protein KsCSTR_11790 [Candidatus Kuenenia stuttgartiensis]|uniref:Uncharacterized protein n=1 Tax=Kuenenia stuttgartiensis TaxID=174633 RepID=A0A6G7GLU7_KUEST|nr:hypothetical protein KsCSTR_11790 [Candidatus Kuenenia stuttgartiensis]
MFHRTKVLPKFTLPLKKTFNVRISGLLIMGLSTKKSGILPLSNMYM